MAAACALRATGLELLPPPGLEAPVALSLDSPPLEMPTLLTSRTLASGMGPCKAPRPLDGYPMYVHVRNTFIETAAEPSALLDGFFQERQVRTCPASHIGRLANLFEDVGYMRDCRKASRPPSPGSESTASTAGPAPRAVLSLADSLSPRSRAVPPPIAPAPGPAELLRLSVMGSVPPPPIGLAPGSTELPSLGSAGHAAGRCKPCAFFHTSGCENGPTCSFCHLCEPEERKRRRKEKLQARKIAHQLRAARRAGGAPSEQSL